MHVMTVEEMKFTGLQGDNPINTDRPVGVNPVPVTVTEVPPEVGPDSGKTPVRVKVWLESEADVRPKDEVLDTAVVVTVEGIEIEE